MEESLSESPPVDLFPQALPKIPSDASYPRNQRKLSVREIKIQRSEASNKYAAFTRHSRAKALWKTAFSLISSRGDPWEKFHLQELPEEMAKRYRYNAIKGKWIEDIVRVKIENSPFNRGAMRECFRAKKLSNFSHCSDWSYASNHVAKRYIEKVETHVYFDDVRLQMDAKLWGEEYSRQPSAPKKVDISQMCVLEFINRPEKPLYHLEHFIEGTYRKYNSNSGFVDDLSRNTPQAFSHFTFERSGHRLIVVDIQGVGNLWTDPQIHTFDGKSYGDGNLGIRGMALFFYTHRCNPLCLALSLSAFDLPISEKLSTPFSQLSMKAADNQTENTNGISDNNNNVELSGTVAIPASRRDRYGIRRLVSENIDSSYDLQNNANNHNNDTSSDFVSPIDFVESHSVPSPKLPFLPSRSPVLCRNDILQKTDQINHNSNVISNNGKHNTKYSNNNNTTTTDNNNNNNGNNDDARNDDLIFGPISLHNNSYDSGISFDGPSFGNVFKAQQSIISDPGCDPVCSDLDQSNSHLNSSESSQQLSKEAELIEFFRLHQAGHRSSSIAALHGADTVILGLIHHELARLHASGRLALMHQTGYCQLKCNEIKKHQPSIDIEQELNGNQLNELNRPQNVNWESVLFHLEQSAKLGCLDAIQCLAQYYLNLMIDGPLSECPIKPDPVESRAHGFALISAAASAGDRMAMLYLAEAYYHGDYYSPDTSNHINNNNNGRKQEPDWLAAAHWYEMAAKVVTYDDDATEDDETNQRNPSFVKRSRSGFHSLSEWPIYRLQGRLGEMYAKGGHGLVRDRIKAYELFESAAEGASEAHDGRIAMKYYEQASLLEEYTTVEFDEEIEEKTEEDK
ncbi:unnamed protein product [Schistosoma margrebowiei]|uniref:Eukaryotic elongation factor 2 kinase n=2 Tax=Schistosoma margrebowiei TaxID=48269 RepID=A0AA84ZCR7_9TREM|nr:unnamed protein product [Schistosoma margrebowiei]